MELVEALVLDALKGWMDSFKLANEKSTEADDIKKIDTVIALTHKKFQTLESQESKTYEFLEQGVYTTEIFLKRQQELSKQKDALNAELQKLKDER